MDKAVEVGLDEQMEGELLMAEYVHHPILFFL